MTRKDYIALANAINFSHDHLADDDKQGHRAVGIVAELVADSWRTITVASTVAGSFVQHATLVTTNSYSTMQPEVQNERH